MHHDNIRRFVDILRRVARDKLEQEPYLIGINSHSAQDFRPLGFDENLKFEPQLDALPQALDANVGSHVLRKRNQVLGVQGCELHLFDYAESRHLMQNFNTPKPAIPCVMVGFDNSPRRGKDGVIIINNTPEAFGKALSETIANNLKDMPQNDLIFINAWNEWAEGNYLEPDQKTGYRYLEELRKAK